MIEQIKEGFRKQAEICSNTSILYRDILNYCSTNDKICNLVQESYKLRDFTGALEAVLTFISYFHFRALEEHPIKSFFESYGGIYQEKNYDELIEKINNIFKQEENIIKEWMKNTILQTNETARSAVIYPALLSLGLKEINLIELGSSAGLILYMDKFSYQYVENDKSFISDTEKPLITSKVNDLTSFEKIFNNRNCLDIKSRLGFDLNCIDLNDENNIKFLKSAIWDSPKRLERLENAINVQKKYSLSEPIISNSTDYTKNLPEKILENIDKNIATVIYTSVSTYQISDDLYEKLLEQIKLLNSSIEKLYFIEFEAPRKKEHLGISQNKDEPFILKISDISNDKKSIFSFAHFHGLSISLVQ
jgi:hypothetical protein